MPPTPTAAVSYKKKDGTVTISGDQKYLFFTPPQASSPAVTIPVSDITNLQQTPESSAKVALKIFVKDENYVFSFTSKDAARKEQEAMTDALRNRIASNKAASNPLTAASTPTPAPGRQQQDGANGDAGQSASMAIAKAISSTSASDDSWYDDKKLVIDNALQQSLLESNPTLKSRHEEALRSRPDGVSLPQLQRQFWSARLHLLRAHAIEKAQKQGEYNVLPEIKFTIKRAENPGEADIRQLNITKEQIQLLFRQYPVVKEAYDELVPKAVDANGFWTRFFSSRLLKKLKGEKISQQDPSDTILDKYLERQERNSSGPAGGAFTEMHIPNFIDLEGNEQNHSQRLGNRPDQDMRPSSYDKVPILRVLNNLSEKMLSHVAPEDSEAHQPIGMDEEKFEQLRLRDLAMEDEDHRVRLNVREQKGYLGEDEGDDLSKDAKLYQNQDPDKVLSGLRTNLQPSHFGSDKNGTLRLDRAIGYHSDEDSDSEDESVPSHQTNGATKKKATVGSLNAMNAASNDILSSIKSRRAASSADPSSLHGLSQATFDQLAITHNTTTEFLHYFWTLFLSGDASRVPELEQLAATLDRSLDRIKAVADLAEQERQKKLDDMKAQVKEYEKRTGKRRKLDESGVEGGRAVVDGMIKPTVEALKRAGEVYRKALEEQMHEAAAGGT